MGGAVQLMGIIRTLLDPENMMASVNKSEKTDFLTHFYKHCMHGKEILSSTASKLSMSNMFCSQSSLLLSSPTQLTLQRNPTPTQFRFRFVSLSLIMEAIF